MIQRGQVFVRAIDPDGRWFSSDALDLNDESFRRFILDRMHVFGMLSVMVSPHDKDEPLRSKAYKS